MGVRLQQKSLTLNDLERQFTALSSLVSVYYDETDGAKITRFSL